MNVMVKFITMNVQHNIIMRTISKQQPFVIEWRCFSCGHKCQSRRALYSHLQGCYWYSVFKDRLEDAPFYKKIPSKQLRYYYRKRPEILKKRNKQRKREEELGIRRARSSGTITRKHARLPKTLK